MRVESDQKRTAGALGVMLLAAVAGLWWPLHLKEARLQQAIAATSTVPGMGVVDVHRLGPLAQEVADLRQNREAHQRCIPKEPEVADLLKALCADLEALKVVDQETQSQVTQSGSEFNVVPVTLHFRAPFAAVHEFLARVESMPRLVRVTHLEISRPGNGGAPGQGPQMLNVSVELCTFFAGAEEAKP